MNQFYLLLAFVCVLELVCWSSLISAVAPVLDLADGIAGGLGVSVRVGVLVNNIELILNDFE